MLEQELILWQSLSFSTSGEHEITKYDRFKIGYDRIILDTLVSIWETIVNTLETIVSIVCYARDAFRDDRVHFGDDRFNVWLRSWR